MSNSFKCASVKNKKKTKKEGKKPTTALLVTPTEVKMKAARLNEILPARFRTTSATTQTTTDYIAMQMCAFLYKKKKFNKQTFSLIIFLFIYNLQ